MLNEVSDSSRITPYLIQFLRHPNSHVRSKAVLMLGKANMNVGRTRQFLASEEPRIRANTIESLWDNPSPEARMVLLQCIHDPAQRVVINALVGLCRLGDKDAPKRLIALSQAPEPVVRAGAAWGMGHASVGKIREEFQGALDALCADPDSKVQAMAKRVLKRVESTSPQTTSAQAM